MIPKIPVNVKKSTSGLTSFPAK